MQEKYGKSLSTAASGGSSNSSDVNEIESCSSRPKSSDTHADLPDIHNEASMLGTVQRTTTSKSTAGPPHSVFTRRQKQFIVFMASWAGFFSPVSANIYLPALNALAIDLHVTNSLINLTLTSYMIFQALAPAFIGNLADSMGRRPAYFICFAIYLAANLGLALQNSYAALFVLRCLQSTGSSATIALSSAVVSDIATPAERGSYMGYVTAGSLLGPAIGPVLGGILTQFLGWRAIFWFLVIFAGSFIALYAIFCPETARALVGNGSIAAKGLNMSVLNYLAARREPTHATQSESTCKAESNASQKQETISEERPLKPKLSFPNPLSCLKILLDKENALLLFFNGFMFAVYYDVTAIIPSQFARVYHFNDLQIGLCFIPLGVGSMIAALFNGVFLDRNFRRWCNKLGVQIKKGRDQDLRAFPIEKARLQIAMPAVYVSAALVLIFGWVLDREGPLAVLLVVMFLGAFCLGVAFNVTSTLLVDFYPKRSATATAANNLVRCLLGAAATGLLIPMVDGMGLGWCFTFLSLVLVVSSPMLWLLMWKGMEWREQRRLKEEEADRKLQASRVGSLEDGRLSTQESSEDVKIASREQQPSSSLSVTEGGTPELIAAAQNEKQLQGK